MENNDGFHAFNVDAIKFQLDTIYSIVLFITACDFKAISASCKSDEVMVSPRHEASEEAVLPSGSELAFEGSC